jgi:hypothetical protein
MDAISDHSPVIIFCTVARGSVNSSSVTPPPPRPSSPIVRSVPSRQMLSFASGTYTYVVSLHNIYIFEVLQNEFTKQSSTVQQSWPPFPSSRPFGDEELGHASVPPCQFVGCGPRPDPSPPILSEEGSPQNVHKDRELTSAIRKTLIQDHDLARIVSWLRPSAPWLCMALSTTPRATVGTINLAIPMSLKAPLALTLSIWWAALRTKRRAPSSSARDRAMSATMVPCWYSALPNVLRSGFVTRWIIMSSAACAMPMARMQ